MINNSQSKIKNCIVEYPNNAISILQSSPVIEENEVRDFRYTGIWTYMQNSAIIKNNIIHNFRSDTYGTGISTYGGNPTIECNTIYAGSGRGIISGDGGLIKNNHIYAILAPGSYGIGISVYAAANPRIENNVIHHCSSGINYGETIGTGPRPLIVNNTIYSNTTAISSSGYFGNPEITRTIIANNTNGILQGPTWNLTPTEISHNLFWNNPAGDYAYIPITGLGQIVNTNSNGDPVDSYFNIFKDPLFVTNIPPFYSSNSPCKNVGNSIYSPNIGCDPLLMCAAMILGVKENKITAKGLAFPNPFSFMITITGLDKNKVSTTPFYDISGKHYAAALEWDTESNATIKKDDLSSVIYFLEISFSDASKQYIRLIKE